MTTENKKNKIRLLTDEARNFYYELLRDESLSIEERFEILVEFEDYGFSYQYTDFNLPILITCDNWPFNVCDMSQEQEESVAWVLDHLANTSQFNFTEDDIYNFKKYCVKNFYSLYKYSF